MKPELTKILLIFSVLFLAVLVVACESTPKKTRPVENFYSSRYLGRWYEIARFDFMFEKNMKNVTANYSMNDNGTLNVLNTGYDFKKQEWKEKNGKAKFAGRTDVGALKVSFFGPFYSAYTIIALDPDYNYALVAGANKKLLWILSRTPTIPEDVKQDYLEIARKAGYNTSGLVWTIQENSY